MSLFLKSLLIGFAIAAPVGPIGLLCIRRSMIDGRLVGLVTGLGAATADAIFGLIAALGVSAITTLLHTHASLIQLVGGLFLVGLGLAMLRAKPAAAAKADEVSPRAPSLPAAYFSTLILTLANPATILAFIGIFSGLGLGLAAQPSPLSAVTLVAGVFLGSCVWWLLLSTGANWLSRRLNLGALRFINLASGSLILAFGLWQLTALLLSSV